MRGYGRGRAQIRLHVVVDFVPSRPVELRHLHESVRREVAHQGLAPCAENPPVLTGQYFGPKRH